MAIGLALSTKQFNAIFNFLSMLKDNFQFGSCSRICSNALKHSLSLTLLTFSKKMKITLITLTNDLFYLAAS